MLFEVESLGPLVTPQAAPVAEPFGAGRDKTFRSFAPDQMLLLPPSLDDWLPAEHLARFIAELVAEHLDLSRVYASHRQVKGAPPYDPRLMVRLLLFGYVTGVRSSRQTSQVVFCQAAAVAWWGQAFCSL